MQTINLGQAYYAQVALSRIFARAGFVPTGTPPKLHRITDRAARKAKARELALDNYNVLRELAFFRELPTRKTLPKGFRATNWGAPR